MTFDQSFVLITYLNKVNDTAKTVIIVWKNIDPMEEVEESEVLQSISAVYHITK